MTLLAWRTIRKITKARITKLMIAVTKLPQAITVAPAALAAASAQRARGGAGAVHAQHDVGRSLRPRHRDGDEALVAEHALHGVVAAIVAYGVAAVAVVPHEGRLAPRGDAVVVAGRVDRLRRVARVVVR